MSRINVGKVAPIPKGNWSSSTAYEKLNLVNKSGILYIAKQDVPANTPVTDTTYWMKATNSLSIGTVNTVSATTGASATITDGTGGQILNLSIPRGVTGNESIDDSAGDGDDDVVWSADKTYNEITDLKNSITVLTKYASSQLTGTGSVSSSRRYMLNVNNPIQKNMLLGELYLIANDTSITCTVRVELTTLNSDGTYNVYDSVTKPYSDSGFASGDLIPVINIGKTTNAETYIFVTITDSAYPRFRIASVSGKNIILSDTITGDTIVTRSASDYEMIYQLYCGATDAFYTYTTHGMDVLNNAVGTYECYEFINASQASGMWNSYIYKNVPSGTKVRFFVSEYTQQAGAHFNVRAFDANGNNQLLGTFDSADTVIEGILTLDAVNFRFQVAIQTAVTNEKLVVDYSDDRNGIVRDLMLSSVPRVFHIEKDGSGDFTNLAQGILAATQWMDSIVYVGPGTWDILEELGQDYLDAASELNQGIVLKNRVHVICSSKAYIKCLYDGTDADVIDHISAFNAGPYGFTLENADIEVANVRYCVHDERNAETDHYDNYYINCRMKNTNQTSGSRAQCIGGGLGYDGHIIIDGCTFENPLRENYGIVSYHNAHGAAIDSRSLIEVKGCYFYGTNTFHAIYYGNTTVITQCLVHGNSMGSAPYITQGDPNYSNVNMEIIAWNNDIRAA